MPTPNPQAGVCADVLHAAASKSESLFLSFHLGRDDPHPFVCEVPDPATAARLAVALTAHEAWRGRSTANGYQLVAVTDEGAGPWRHPHARGTFWDLVDQVRGTWGGGALYVLRRPGKGPPEVAKLSSRSTISGALPLDEARGLRDYGSPLAWGDFSPGCRQLALALLLDHLGDPGRALRLHGLYAYSVLASVRRPHFTLTANDVGAAVADLEEALEREPTEPVQATPEPSPRRRR